MTKTIYLAGPMNGIPEFNFPAFHQVQAFLESLDWRVLSPARENEENGWEDGTDHETATVTGKAHANYLRRDIKLILQSDAIALLPGWGNSSGANIELCVARALGLRVYMIVGSPHDQSALRLVHSTAIPTAQLMRVMQERANEDDLI